MGSFTFRFLTRSSTASTSGASPKTAASCAYRDEEGVASDSETETCVVVRTSVVIELRASGLRTCSPAPSSLCGAMAPDPASARACISIAFRVKDPGPVFAVQTVPGALVLGATFTLDPRGGLRASPSRRSCPRIWETVEPAIVHEASSIRTAQPLGIRAMSSHSSLATSCLHGRGKAHMVLRCHRSRRRHLRGRYRGRPRRCSRRR